MKKIIIAGTQSNTGKTTITTAVMRALKNRGRRVAPFKVGPDYIDPKFHSFVTGTPSHNLDSWMVGENTAKYLFCRNSGAGDISVIEGVMGLYDGKGTGEEGSTAHMAGLLKAPVILVVDAKGMSRSIAAMIKGYVNFSRDTDIPGVILNNISGERHYSLLKEIIDENCSVECLGYFPDRKDIRLSDRHLGLVPVEELTELDRTVDIMASLAEEHIDLDRLEQIAESPSPSYQEIELPGNQPGRGITAAVAKDKAFSFYYNDNLTLMKESGMELIEFSPLSDPGIPEKADALYLGGGFPEVFAEELSANRPMLDDIKQKLTEGMPAYAECGGLMYLTEGIETHDGRLCKTAGFFGCRSVMTERLQRFGYVEVEYEGITVRAHEFHHSRLENFDDPDTKFSYIVKKAGRDMEWEGGLRKGNVLAGYPHVHFYSNTDFFIKITELFKGNRND